MPVPQKLSSDECLAAVAIVVNRTSSSSFGRNTKLFSIYVGRRFLSKVVLRFVPAEDLFSPRRSIATRSCAQ